MTACPRRHRFRTLINTDENDGPKIRQSTLRGKCRLKPDVHFLCKPGQARVCIEWRSLILGHPDAPARPKKTIWGIGAAATTRRQSDGLARSVGAGLRGPGLSSF